MAKDKWDKADVIGKLTGSLLIPIALAVGSYLFNLALQERADRQKTVELAITVLQSAKTDTTPKLQEWALGVLQQTTTSASQTLPPAVIDEIKRVPLPTANTVPSPATRLSFARVGNGLITTEDFKLSMIFDGIDGRRLDPDRGQNMTSLRYSDGRSLDSLRVPYISVPSTNIRDDNIHFGDYVVVINATNGKQAFAVVGDAGPSHNSMDISPALATLLGVKFKKDVIGNDKLSVLVFPNSVDANWPDLLDQEAAKWFDEWGGQSRMEPYIKREKKGN
ncbi:MAG: Fungal chitosanase of glycosyl hydrolase group 75 [Verrucomicrobiota bacterium]|jgi:hypothetical protein